MSHNRDTSHMGRQHATIYSKGNKNRLTAPVHNYQKMPQLVLYTVD